MDLKINQGVGELYDSDLLLSGEPQLPRWSRVEWVLSGAGGAGGAKHSELRKERVAAWLQGK
eukprot:422102-Hanusia_phi.AAC.1